MDKDTQPEPTTSSPGLPVTDGALNEETQDPTPLMVTDQFSLSQTIQRSILRETQTQPLEQHELCSIPEMQTYYTVRWWQLPARHQYALIRSGLLPIPSTGNFLREFNEMDDIMFRQLAESVRANIIGDPTHMGQDILDILLNMATAPITEITEQMGVWSLQIADHLNSQTQTEDKEALAAQLQRWKQWKPKQVALLPKTSQMMAEKYLVKCWRRRLTSHFLTSKTLPPAIMELIPQHLVDKCAEVFSTRTYDQGKHASTRATLLVNSEVMEDAQLLLGNRRFSSLRNHCQCLEMLLTLDQDFIPWSTNKAMEIMKKLSKLPDSGCRLQRSWKTILMLSNTYKIPIDTELLQGAKDQWIEDNITEYTKESRRASPPTVDILTRLEKVACTSPNPTERLLAGLLRFMTGCSARFNDVQHCQPATLKLYEHTVEATCWQTKTMRLGQSHQKPAPLVAPKTSFSGHEWWKSLMVSYKTLMNQWADVGTLDFMWPRLNKTKTSFCQVAASNQHALSTMRTLLAKHMPDDPNILPLTLHSWRVFMPDLSFQLGIDREKRRYLGRWAVEETSDKYTRNLRDAVIGIWQEAQQRMPDVYTPQARCIDLTDSSWDLPQGRKRPLQETFLDIPHERGGPGQLVRYHGRIVFHCLLTTGKTLCGFQPSTSNSDVFTLTQWRDLDTDFRLPCASCFAKTKMPPEWETATPAYDHRLESSDDNHSSDSSEDEQV